MKINYLTKLFQQAEKQGFKIWVLFFCIFYEYKIANYYLPLTNKSPSLYLGALGWDEGLE